MASQFINIVTGKGILSYPHLKTADTKFSEVGAYKTGFIVDQAGHDILVGKLQPILDEYVNSDKERKTKHKSWSVSLPFDEQLDDQGDETGNYIWKFSQKAYYVKDDGERIDFSVSMIDAQRQPIDVNPYGGTVAKIRAQVRPYAMSTSKSYGLSLKPNMVQILELVSGGGASTDGFDEEEGYVAPAAPATPADDFADADGIDPDFA